MTADGSGHARSRGALVPGLVALAVFAALVALGTWQLQRKAWKEALLATLTERLAAAPGPLPALAEWSRLDRDDYEFRRVIFPVTFLHDREALVYAPSSSLRAGAPSGPGYHVFTPARLADGGAVIVDRGFVPENRRDAGARADGQVAGPVDITGVMRWPEAPTPFSPAANPTTNLWFVRDSASIAAAKGIEAAPFYVEQEAPAPPGGWPQPARLKPNLPNNHLQYAVTWYGLAFALLAVFAAWTIRNRRARHDSRGPPTVSQRDPKP
jgi:surfeit locus 1 family protein